MIIYRTPQNVYRRVTRLNDIATRLITVSEDCCLDKLALLFFLSISRFSIIYSICDCNIWHALAIFSHNMYGTVHADMRQSTV